LRSRIPIAIATLALGAALLFAFAASKSPGARLGSWLGTTPPSVVRASVPVPEALRGVSLRAEIEGSGSNADRLVANGNRNTGALRDGRYKLLYRGKNSAPQLFDLEADPLE
jgi:hypothetical protein